jgi:membrane associated rhomboid family serine protease
MEGFTVGAILMASRRGTRHNSAMLLIPLPEGSNWRRPPPVTLALILLNVLVFLAYQSGDSAREERLKREYFSSSLPALELPAYQVKLEREHPELQARLARAPREYLFVRMESDAEFMRELRGGRIVTESNPAYAQWRADRARVDGIEATLSFRRFGFTPADARPATWITSLFLHGDLMHLAGNMVFLFILGVAVELPLGAFWFLSLYLLSGLAGNAMQWAVDPSSSVPSVGASGAISGLMGMFAVVFGMRPVRFFYWLVFVFGFRALRGLAVLPLWIGWEVLQYLTDRGSHVGYMAHAGGLVAGAFFGAVVRHRLAAARVERFHEQREEEAGVKADYERARMLAAKLDYAGANTVFARLAQRIPDDIEMLKQWHAIARRTPASDHYHQACGAILGLRRPDAPTRAWQAQVLAEYVQRAGQAPRIAPAALARVAHTFTMADRTADAQVAVDLLFKVAPDDKHLPAIWNALAKALSQPGADAASLAQAKRYRTLIATRARAAAAP